MDTRRLLQVQKPCVSSAGTIWAGNFTNMPTFLCNFISPGSICIQTCLHPILFPFLFNLFELCVSLLSSRECTVISPVQRKNVNILKVKKKKSYFNLFCDYYDDRNHHQKSTSQEDQFLPQSSPLPLIFLFLFYILIYSYKSFLLQPSFLYKHTFFYTFWITL